MKVYILTTVDFSDMSIDAVFMDKEKAEVAAEAFNRDATPGYCRVEEWEVEEDQPVTLYSYSFYETTKGQICFRGRNKFTVRASLRKDYYAIVTLEGDPLKVTSGYTYGETPEEAKKIAYDTIAKAKAEKSNL